MCLNALHFVGRSCDVKRILFALMAASLTAMPLRAQDLKPSDSLTPAFGEGLAKGKPLCKLPRVPQSAATKAESLPLGAGTIKLPVDFTAEPQELPKSKRWNGDDSTTFTVLVAPYPMGGMAHSGGGGVKFVSAPACVISVDGHHAVVERLSVVMRADTIYLAIIPVFARPGGIVNASIEATSAQRRDEIISRVAAISLAR
jgi:hypothetical protein